MLTDIANEMTVTDFNVRPKQSQIAVTIHLNPTQKIKKDGVLGTVKLSFFFFFEI